MSEPAIQSPPLTGWRRVFSTSENLLVVAVLGAMVMVPLIEAGLRSTLNIGIAAATTITQHLTLFVGMLGGVIAARQQRLLSLSTVSAWLQGRPAWVSKVFSSSVAAVVATFLCVASWQFVMSEKAGGARFAYDVPLWVIQIILPVGFGLIAVRLIWHASAGWGGRAAALGLAAALVWAALKPPMSPDQMVIPALSALLVATALGAPVFATLGGAALILFWGDELPIASIPLDHYRLVTNPSLPTIPLFTLAGYFLAEGGASKRLVRVFQALFGAMRGGPAIVTALVCAFFTSFTGASGVTILALGGLLMPVLLAARYSERDSIGLLTGAGSLGLLFPPCLPLILYAIIAKVKIEAIFLGGILPGVLMVGMTVAWSVWRAPKGQQARQLFSWKEAGRAVWDAKGELALPVVALAGLFGGFATPVEAAALTALYAFFVEVVMYRDLKVGRDVPRVMTECGLLVGGVLLILGVALGFTNYLVDAQVPTRAVEWAKENIDSPWKFLLLLNLFLLVVGCLMDIYSAIIVVVPLLVPLGVAFQIDPVHLGIIFLANLQLGYLTPPVGMNLFLAAYRFQKPMSFVIRAAMPMLLVLLVSVLVITYVPAMTTFLPKLLLK
jgi:tripartite ATP-independent transporter DctM subunit